MRTWLRLAAAIDRISEFAGRFAAALVLLMVVVGAYNAVVRYLGRHIGANLSSNAYIELQWYLFSLVFLLGAAYTLRHDAHVRVDVVFERLSERGRAWVNVLGTVLFLLPFSVLMLWLTWPSVRNSWAVRELSPDPGGLPRYPIKAVILIGFLMLTAQGIAHLIQNIAILRGKRHEDPSQTAGLREGV